MKVLNFYGGAGIGKSTIAADVFSKLKHKGHKTELVGEYAKWLWYQNAGTEKHGRGGVFIGLGYNEAEDVPHFRKWGVTSKQAVSISLASLKGQLEDFAYGKI